MKKSYLILLALWACFTLNCNAQSKNLTLIFIRHAERPDDGDNLNCQGLNRSMQLPAVLFKKFRKPSNVYIPALKQGEITKRSRMFQTVTPFLVKYDLTVNTSYDEEDNKGVAKALLQEKGNVIIVWEHKNIPPILKSLGVKEDHLKWGDDDFDTIWIVTFHKGKANLQRDTEGIKPAATCPF